MPYLILVTIVWAFSFSLIGQYLAGQVDSDLAVLVRVAIAAAVFIPFTRWRGLPARLLGGFWLAGALQFGITYLCLYRSFTVLTVPEVLLFTVLTPIYVTLLDDALARRFNPWALVAALVAVGGGIIIRFEKIEGAAARGDGLAFGWRASGRLHGRFQPQGPFAVEAVPAISRRRATRSAVPGWLENRRAMPPP